MPAQSNFTETRIAMSDPTALGVFGLSMVTFVAASQKMGWTTGVVYLIPWALFLGSIAQVWASFVDFRKNNYFGAIVLGAYGLFWSAVAMHWAISLGWFGAVGDKGGSQAAGIRLLRLYDLLALYHGCRVRGEQGIRSHPGDDQRSASVAGPVPIGHLPWASSPCWRPIRNLRFRCWACTAPARSS